MLLCFWHSIAKRTGGLIFAVTRAVGFKTRRAVNNESYPFNNIRALILSKGTSLGKSHPTVRM